MTHWPPRKGEQLYDSARFTSKEWPSGIIIAVLRNYGDPDSSEVMVKFENLTPVAQRRGRYVLAAAGDIFWNGLDPTFDPNVTWSYIWVGEEQEFRSAPEIKTYYFYELEGNWDSSDGGMGRWEI